MEVVANNYLPGDQRLVDKIVYELKAQGIFDQFRKECFADVDTKPAYQNLRQRVEGSVAGFLKEQSWRPDMNKNQVREMLRKKITESGYLETGVERIVDQVVNPKINTVFLPKVEEVVYNYLGIKKPNRNESGKSECDLLPNDLEAVSPESETTDKKEDKSTDNFQEMDESKTEEDESPPFEPLEEQSVFPQEENSVDSHMSGFSISHESNQSNENKPTPMEQDSQMSRNSSDSRLSIVTSDENSKTETFDDTKTAKSDDKNKHKSERHKSRSESSRSDKDRKSSKDSKSRHNSSSKDKDSSRDRKDSKSSSSKSDKDKDKSKEKSDKDHSKSRHSSHSSSRKRDSSRSDKDKNRSSSSHKDSKSKDKPKEKLSSSSDKHKHTSHSSDKDKHKKEKETKDKKKEKSKDDHYSSKDKKNDRRSTDRDSNDGQSNGKSNPNPSNTESSNSFQTQKNNQESNSGGNFDQSDNTTKATTENLSMNPQKLKVLKPKCASNIQEALRLRKIRKQLAKLEKQNQLSLASVDVNSPILMSASINLDELDQNYEGEKVETDEKMQSTVTNWDEMEAKLREEVTTEFQDMEEDEEECKYFESVDVSQNEFLAFADKEIKKIDNGDERKSMKRKIDDNDVKNNNKEQAHPEKKIRVVKKNKDKINNHSVIDKFSLPLSPAESDKSIGTPLPLKVKRSNVNKINNQRYSSDDLYKPRPTFASSRRRSAKNLEN